MESLEFLATEIKQNYVPRFGLKLYKNCKTKTVHWISNFDGNVLMLQDRLIPYDMVHILYQAKQTFQKS